MWGVKKEMKLVFILRGYKFDLECIPSVFPVICEQCFHNILFMLQLAREDYTVHNKDPCPMCQ
jgi:hypothetical protein